MDYHYLNNPDARYHVVKLTTMLDTHNTIVGSKVLTDQALCHPAAIRFCLVKIAEDMEWPIDFAKNIYLDAVPTKIDLEEFRAINWNPNLLTPESKLRWAMWKLQIDGNFKVPGFQPRDNYGVHTYMITIC